MQAFAQAEAKEERRLGTAFLVALMLHVGALGALAIWSSRDERSAPGEQEFAIDLAPAMDFAEAMNAVEAAMPAEALAAAAEVDPSEPATMEPAPPEEAAEVEEMTEAQPQVSEVAPPQEAAEAVPVEAQAADAPEVVTALPPPEEAAVAKVQEEKPKPRPVKRPPEKKAERKSPRRDVAEQRSAPATPRQGQASSSREDTGGAAASADPDVLNRYVSQLYAALRRRLRYPETARARGIEGVATIRFTMQRSGRIVSASLVRSTGHAILDQAALAAAGPGSSLPAAPDAIPQQNFTFSVPLRFDLR